jgi:hypothetical protein
VINAVVEFAGQAKRLRAISGNMEGIADFLQAHHAPPCTTGAEAEQSIILPGTISLIVAIECTVAARDPAGGDRDSGGEPDALAIGGVNPDHLKSGNHA